MSLCEVCLSSPSYLRVVTFFSIRTFGWAPTCPGAQKHAEGHWAKPESPRRPGLTNKTRFLGTAGRQVHCDTQRQQQVILLDCLRHILSSSSSTFFHGGQQTLKVPHETSRSTEAFPRQALARKDQGKPPEPALEMRWSDQKAEE